MIRIRTLVSVTAGLAGALFTVANALASPGHGEGPSSGFAGGEPGKPGEVDRTVHITAGDTYFEPKALEVRAGETVRFVVENQGQLRHDFTLGSPEVQKAHRAEMAERLKPAAMEGHSDPNAVMLAPGETASVIWRFEKTDRFLFGCNIPGHFEAGMKGKIAIQPAGT